MAESCTVEKTIRHYSIIMCGRVNHFKTSKYCPAIGAILHKNIELVTGYNHNPDSWCPTI